VSLWQVSFCFFAFGLRNVNVVTAGWRWMDVGAAGGRGTEWAAVRRRVMEEDEESVRLDEWMQGSIEKWMEREGEG